MTDTPANPVPVPDDAAARKRNIRAVVLAWTFGITAALVYGVVQYVPAAGWYINDVSTSKTIQYPELQSRVYDSSPENATVFAAAAASRLPRWKVIRTDLAEHVVICEVKTPLGLFTDDVTVRIEPYGSAGDTSRVIIRSRSRIARADLGQNARHIRELQSAMDDKLPRLTP